MGQTSWGEVVTIVLGVALVLVEAGRWAGGLETRRAARKEAAQPPTSTGSNGTPTTWELSRRLDRFEHENAREHEEIRKDYRGINTAQTRRIERLEQLS